jgi:hypothetical protein
MTEAEIIKAMECCIKAEAWGDCKRLGCPALTKQGCRFYLRTDDDYENTIYIEILKDALDLLNRKNAENAKLNFENLQMVASIKGLEARAIKEFAERVKAKCYTNNYCESVVRESDLDQIAKEMGVEL